MSDFLKTLLEDKGVESREVTFKGKTGEMHFRRINAGQRAELMKGRRVQGEAGQKPRFDIDLGESEQSKCRLVMYSVCTPEGAAYFRKLDEVKAIDAGLLEVLYGIASDVNKGRVTSGNFGQSVYGHNGKKLIKGPVIRGRLK